MRQMDDKLGTRFVARVEYMNVWMEPPLTAPPRPLQRFSRNAGFSQFRRTLAQLRLAGWDLPASFDLGLRRDDYHKTPPIGVKRFIPANSYDSAA
jgi:hypothetical protein